MTAPGPRSAALLPMCQPRCEVGAQVTLGPGPGPCGERRYLPLGGGTVRGPERQGVRVEGGVGGPLARADGVLEIGANDVVRSAAGAPSAVQSHGLRHGPPEVMDRLARGEAVGRDACFFRTPMRFTTGHPDGLHLNKVMAIAAGQREARRVVLDLYRLA